MDVKGCNEYIPCLTYGEHITKNYWCALLIIGILMYILIFYIIDSMGDTAVKISHTCLAECKSDTCKNIVTGGRDSNYFLSPDSNPKNCWFTIWELSHMIMHIFIGYFYNLQTSLGVSVGFEVFEHYAYDCASILDIFWNMLGFSIGYSIRYFRQIYQF